MKISSLDEYQQLALRTARSTLNQEVRRCNWAMGLAGEAGEVLDLFLAGPIDKDQLTDELGDVYWYGAVMADEWGYKLSDLRHAEVLLERTYTHARLPVAACQLCDYIKKVLCHGHKVDRKKLLNGLALTMKYAQHLAEDFGIDPADVMSRNIEKLMRRYPEGFATERSVNREG